MPVISADRMGWWRASAALLLPLAGLLAAAQNQLWVKQFGTTEADSVSAATPAGLSGVYTSGSTTGSLGGPNAGSYDAWLARYDSAGNQLWVRQLGTFNSDTASASAADASGGVFIAGSTTGSLGGPKSGLLDAWLARYDGAGNQLWVRQLGTSDYDALLGAAPDASGGLYVCGWTMGNLAGPNAGLEDAWLARYDSAGNQLWVRQLGTTGFDDALAAAPDGAGGVYLTGWTDGVLGSSSAGGDDAWLARYDSAGNQLWIRQIGTMSKDVARAAAPDGSNGVYVSGDTKGDLGGTSAGQSDAWLARYDSSGTQLWVRQLGTSADDSLTAAAMDVSSGGAYVSGWTFDSLGGPSAGFIDAWLARCDSAGNQIWAHQLGTSEIDMADAAAPDLSSGGVCLGGSTFSSLAGPSAGGYDGWLARYDGTCGASSYCTASTTSIPGCKAAIGSTGAPSLFQPSGFTISSGSVPGGGNVGICFFGDDGPLSLPFGSLGGQLCVKPPIFRSGPKVSGGSPGVCNGALLFTLQDLIDASPIVVGGAQIQAEIWARDPPNPDGFLLSNALKVTVCF